MLIPSPSLKTFFYDLNGLPLSGGKLYTYIAGTNEPQDTYTDNTGLFVNSNPIVLDAFGGCDIFIKTNSDELGNIENAYKFELFDKNGVLQWTEDNIVSLRGAKGTATGLPGADGEKGDDGAVGVGKPGKQGQKGNTGPRGKNGSKTIFWRTNGDYTFIVPANVYEIEYIMGGAGGGWHLDVYSYLPQVGDVASGTAGQIINGKITVSPGDIINIKIGKGGIASENPTLAMGENTYFEGETVTRITASGGYHGNSHNIRDNGRYHQKMNPLIIINTYEGYPINIKPIAVFGETAAPFGQGGNFYSYQDPNARGNCASGGTSVPFLITATTLGISDFGRGGDGIIQFTFLEENNE